MATISDTQNITIELTSLEVAALAKAVAAYKDRVELLCKEGVATPEEIIRSVALSSVAEKIIEKIKGR